MLMVFTCTLVFTTIKMGMVRGVGTKRLILMAGKVHLQIPGASLVPIFGFTRSQHNNKLTVVAAVCRVHRA